MIRVYRINGTWSILILGLILLLIIAGIFLLLPLAVLGIVLLGVYLLYRRFKVSINEFIWKLRKKKIKIKDTSQSGDVKINFGRKIPIEDSSETYKTKELKEEFNGEVGEFIGYLKNIGMEFKDGVLYYNNKKLYPIYRRSYPVNEIIKLTIPDNFDAIILGLKGFPYEPKFLYLIPINEAKERMSVDELKKYEFRIKSVV
ncbi:hypothetical protein [Methanotorris formicicus]|uniref:Uncharacterized protein n=1 Tax=Methanotorris formicicus Mc-S-70 TaxID=647171 RepID=H1L001_9EURY|nr:hypothetical protein [Methanotorris formicicus]EHP85411.1 hypothetical protein MetfoDRAFT_1375 [Methanotorris formicicus Mc-S-70]